MRLRSGTVTHGTSQPPPTHSQPLSEPLNVPSGERTGLDSVSNVGSPARSVTSLDTSAQFWAHHQPGVAQGQRPPWIGADYGMSVAGQFGHPWIPNPLFFQPPPHTQPMQVPLVPHTVPHCVAMVDATGQPASLPQFLPPSTQFPPSLPVDARATSPHGDAGTPYSSPSSPHHSVQGHQASRPSDISNVTDQLIKLVQQQQEQIAQQTLMMQRLMEDRVTMTNGHHQQQPSLQQSTNNELQALRLQTSYDQAAAACPKLKRLEPKYILQFMRQAKKHFQKYNIGDRHILERLSTFVVDKAYEWLDNKLLLQSTGEEPEWTTFDEFLQSLKNDHPEPVASFTVLQQLMSPKVRQLGRPVQVYHGELVKLFSTEHHSFDQRFQVAYFVLGLDPDVQSQLMRDYPQTLTEAFTAAASLEASLKPLSTRTPAKHQAEEQRQLHRQQQEFRQRRLEHVDRYKQLGQRSEGVRFEPASPTPKSALKVQPPSSGSGPSGSNAQGTPPHRPSRNGHSGRPPKAFSIFTSAEGNTLVLDADGKLAAGETFLIPDDDLTELKQTLEEDPEKSVHLRG